MMQLQDCRRTGPAAASWPSWPLPRAPRVQERCSLRAASSRPRRRPPCAHGSPLDGIWSSQLLYTEALRAGARLGFGTDLVEDALDTISLVMPSVTTFSRAGQLQRPALRSLDAIHLATALELGDDLEGLVAYDAASSTRRGQSQLRSSLLRDRLLGRGAGPSRGTGRRTPVGAAARSWW
jgi:hypothetical protein